MNLRTVNLALCLYSLCIATAYAQVNFVVPPDEKVEGLSQAEWSRAWWQWAGSFNQRKSPLTDKTGALCGQKQAGPVWFLAGAYGTERTVKACTLPRGKYVFLPLINYVAKPSAGKPAGCDAMTSEAARVTEEVSSLAFDADAFKIPDLASYRQATPECFDMGALAKPKVRIYPSAGNGYYVMLRPMPPGTHTLNYSGSLPNMNQSVTYILTVQ